MCCEPETANKRGASAPAPGSEWKMKKSGCALATSSILFDLAVQIRESLTSMG